MMLFYFYILIGFSCLIVTGILNRNFRTNVLVNFWLLFLFYSGSIILIIDGLCYLGYFNIYYVTILKYFQILFFSPAGYLYFVDLESNNKIVKKEALLHFILPALFFIVVLMNYFFYFTSNHRYVQLFFILLYIIFYISSTLKFLFESALHDGFKKYSLCSKTLEYWIVWICTLFIIIDGVLFFSVLDEIINIIKFGYIYEFIYVLCCSLINVIFIFNPDCLKGNFYVLNHSNTTLLDGYWIFSGIEIKEVDFELRDKIGDDVEVYIKEIIRGLKNTKLTRDGSLGLTEFSKNLGIPKYYIVFIFKYYCRLSFVEYLKFYRVLDAMTLIDQNYLFTNTIESLALEVGFCSYNPFLVNFKIYTNTSPIKYSRKNNATNCIDNIFNLS
jgi:AraC-like DNA-binding protein